LQYPTHDIQAKIPEGRRDNIGSCVWPFSSYSSFHHPLQYLDGETPARPNYTSSILRRRHFVSHQMPLQWDLWSWPSKRQGLVQETSTIVKQLERVPVANSLTRRSILASIETGGYMASARHHTAGTGSSNAVRSSIGRSNRD
jgi:hypothetical protein